MGKKSNKIFVIAAFDENEQKVIKRNKNIFEITGSKSDELKPSNFVSYVYKWGGNPNIGYGKNPYNSVYYKTLRGITDYYNRNIKDTKFSNKNRLGDPFIYEIPASDWNMYIDRVINSKQEIFNKWKKSQESRKLIIL